MDLFSESDPSSASDVLIMDNTQQHQQQQLNQVQQQLEETCITTTKEELTLIQDETTANISELATVSLKTTTTTTTTSTTTTTLVTNEPIMENLKPEVEFGNIEYKLKLINPTPDRLEHLTSQLKWRLGEGMGEAIYELGVEDDGTAVGLPEEDLQASIETLQAMAGKLSADLTIIRERNGSKGKVLEVLIRKYASDDFSEIRVHIVGNVDSGKSTLLGVLTRGQLDNGRGSARTNVFRHKHEIESGRTSSISSEILGFNSKGGIVNYNNLHGINPSEICEMSSKIINFVDLAGHEKYLKTTLYGMTGCYPDYCMLMIGANNGVIGMTREHLGLALALRVPVFVVVTKIDRCPENILNDTLNDIKKILKSPGSRKLPVSIKSLDDVVVAARNFISERIAPIFCVSNVTGENLNLLKSFLNLLPAKKDWENVADQPARLDIDAIYSVVGTGTVVSGTLMKGVISVGDNLLIGPDDSGIFHPTQVKSIQTKRLPVKQVRAGQTASIALKKIKRSQIRKGMVLVHPNAKPQPTREFEAEVVVLFHSTTISPHYEAVIHCCATQQCGRIIEIDKGVIRTGDKAKVKFRYLMRPEFLTVGSRFIFREGRAKGTGIITKLLPFVPEPKDIVHHKVTVAGTGSGVNGSLPKKKPSHHSRNQKKLLHRS
ncbi:hypothetical protein CYY_009797 [Polysphondylium violaceum]|uniref:Tr-type G domain-containing protein n=1 Tax=Polysphondylium violaceum TaxID=133409 RepID=A0A8J4UP90_9MYCE|nr:hypothetical protein CYY_009797 [Polysphondylium violaceum]